MLSPQVTYLEKVRASPLLHPQTPTGFRLRRPLGQIPLPPTQRSPPLPPPFRENQISTENDLPGGKQRMNQGRNGSSHVINNGK